MKKILIILCTLLVLCGCSINHNNSNFNNSFLGLAKESDFIDDKGNIYVYVYGISEKIYTPESSIVDYISYYKESKHMIVSLNEKEYIHSNVSEEIWEDFKNADSKGSYYSEHFKGNPDYWVIGYNGNNGSKINVVYKIGLNKK